MSLLLKFFEKIKYGWLKKLLIGILCFLDFACVIGFFVLPFIRYSEKFVVFAFILWSCSALLFCVAAFIMYKNDLKSDKKAIEEYQKDKVVYTVGRFGVLLYFVSMFCLVFLTRNDLVKVSLFGIIGIAILGLLLFGVIITLLTQYKNNYLKMAKDTFRVLYVFFAVILFSVVMLSGIMVHGNENYPEYVSQFFVGISAIPLLLGGIYLVCKMFLSNKMLNEKSDGLPISIILFIALGIITCILLRYVITDCKMQEIMTTIFASILGGSITLAGVAWTIKDGTAKRDEELKRVENERKEEERKKLTPYIMVTPATNKASGIAQIQQGDSFDFAENADKMEDDAYYVTYFRDLYVKNISASNVILKGLFLNDTYYPFLYQTLLECNGICKILLEGYWKATAQKISCIKLLLTDILENEYSVPCRYQYELNEKPQKDGIVRDNGIEYTCYSYTYELKCFGMPERLKDGETGE